MGSLAGQLFDSAPGLFDARGGNFDGPWEGIGNDAVSVILDEPSATELQYNRTDTLDVSLTEAQTSFLRSTRADETALALVEVQTSFIQSSRVDGVDVSFDDHYVSSISDPMPSLLASDALSVNFQQHDETLNVLLSRSDAANIMLGEDRGIYVELSSADDIDLSLDDAGNIIVPISAIDSINLSCDDAGTVKVIISSSDRLDVKLLRAAERTITRGGYYDDVTGTSGVNYLDV